jgi:PAS domain S-box-containing protein
MSRSEPSETSTPVIALERDNVRALLIDDDQGDFEFTRALMSQIERPKITLDWVSTFEEGVDALSDNDYDLFFVDYFLEDRTGLDLLREARRRGVKAPMIMLTGRGSHDVDIEAMRAGAADYLIKGKIQPDNVERSVRYALDRADGQAALRASEEKHRTMFDHLPIGLYRCSPEGGFMDANPALVRILGHPDQETLAHAYASHFFVNPTDVERFKVQLHQFGVVRAFSSKIRRVDGSAIRIRNTARTQRGTDGQISYIEGAVEDVSYSLQAGGVERQAARYDKLVSVIDNGLAFASTDGALVDANPVLLSELGYDAGELKGSDVSVLFAEDDREAIRREVSSLARGAVDRAEGHRRVVTKSGELLWSHVVLTSIRDLDDNPEEVMVVFAELGDS